MLHLDFPFGFIINGQLIPIHGLFEILAIWLGVYYYYHLRKNQKDHFNSSQRLTLILAAALGALIGSRLLAAAEHYETLSKNFSWFAFTQSKTIVGGIVGGWISIEVTKKILGITKSSGDLFTYPLILGIIIGRIGCALTGVSDGTVGIPSNLPWAFEQGDGIPRHPTAIYEIIFLLILWKTLKVINKKYQLQNGDIFKFFMISYSTWRLAVEFIKPVTPLILGLSAIQVTCALVIVYYSIVFINRYRLKNTT